MVGEVPGVLWSPVSGSDHAPVVLMGHGGGQHKKTPALMARAHHTVTTWGFTVVAIDAPADLDRAALAVALAAQLGRGVARLDRVDLDLGRRPRVLDGEQGDGRLAYAVDDRGDRRRPGRPAPPGERAPPISADYLTRFF
jgi:hypothetical protein